MPRSMATVAAEPAAGEHLGEQSAGRVPHHGGLLLGLPIKSAVWSATCFSVFLARTSGFARASSTEGSSGQSGVSGA